jgi:hypothetical protein
LFEALTLIQTGKIKNFPIAILMIGGRWSPSRWSLCEDGARNIAPSSIVCSIQMALCVGCVEAGAAFRPGSEGDVVRVIGLVTEIAGPKTPTAPVQKSLAPRRNREAAPVSVIQTQPCY